ncbi:MAG: hypothetical protein ACOYOR_04230 [Flavobacterium psychrophilum]
MKQVFGVNKNNKIIILLKYAFLLIIILQSGSNLFYGMNLGYIFPILLIPYYLFSQKIRVSVHSTIYFFFIFFLHCYYFYEFGSSLSWLTINTFNFFSIYLLIFFLKEKNIIYFFNIIYFISVMCLTIWILIQFSSLVSEILIEAGKINSNYLNHEAFFKTHNDEITSFNAVLYNINLVDNSRNNGIFFEPGRFAIFILFALSINVFYFKKTFIEKKTIILVVTLISTFSTTGYICLLIILFIKSLYIKTNILSKCLFFLFLVIIAYYISNLDFMYDKILNEAKSEYESSRIFAAYYHFQFILQRPLLGYCDFIPDLMLSPNGLTFYILKYGIVSFIIYLFLIYRGLKYIFNFRINDIKAIGIFIIFITLAFSQTITTEPFYIGISYLGLLSKDI